MAKPAVDGLERRLEGRLRVARVNIATQGGRAVAAQYAITAVPAYVLLDGQGNVLYRQVGGRPNVTVIEQRLVAGVRSR